MKKLLVSCLLTVSLLGTGFTDVQAKQIKTYPLYNISLVKYHAKSIKHVHHQNYIPRKELKNYIYILSVQLGSNKHSLAILQNHIFKHDSYKQLHKLYKNLDHAYFKINHHKFNYKYWTNRAHKAE